MSYDKGLIAITKVILGEEEINAVKRVIQSGIFVKGPEVKRFEDSFAKYCNTSFAIAVNSGTNALFLSLLSIGLHHGDEVITTPNTFVATTNAIVSAGGIPKLVDVDRSTMNLDTKALRKNVTKNTKAIIPVHLYGLPVEMDAVMEIANDYNISVIEDACQSHGAEYKGKKTGSLGHLAAFSFYPTKNLTVGGDGGMVLTNDKRKANKIRMLRDHGRESTFGYRYIGFNFRLSEILGAIGYQRLKRLDSDIRRRREIAASYKKYLSDIPQVKLPQNPSHSKHVYYLYVGKFTDRDKLKEYLQNKGIGTAINYPETINQMFPYQKRFNFKNGMFPIAEKLTEEILAIPMFPELKNSEIKRVAAEIRNFYKE